MTDVLSVVISGLLMGAIYALFAGGLTLIWGVMRIINIAHGEFLMLGAFATYFFASSGLVPLLSLPLFAPLFFLFGAAVYLLVIRRIVDAPELISLLLTFGLSILAINLGVLAWSGEMRLVSYLSGSFDVGGVLISKNRLVAGLVAVAISLGMYVFLQRTRWGQAIRAVAYDREIAEQCGIDSGRVYMLVFGLGTALAAVAGGLASTIFAFSPLIGQQFILKAFAVTVLGGMGNFAGALIAGIVLGVVEQLVSFLVDSQIASAVAFVVIILTLLFRPQGILGAR
jgi:branched-chain amino acid transport system permease protein